MGATMLHAKIDIIDRFAVGDGRRAGSARVAVKQPSTVRTVDKVPLDVVVEDLSSTGFRFRHPAPLTVGTVLHVGLAGAGIAQARVVRSDSGQHGCEFAMSLSDEQVRLAFTSPGVVAGAFPQRLATSEAIDAPPAPEKFHGALRVAVAIGGGGLCWAAMIAGVAALVR